MEEEGDHEGKHDQRRERRDERLEVKVASNREGGAGKEGGGPFCAVKLLHSEVPLQMPHKSV